jgi:hypothetical protein
MEGTLMPVDVVEDLPVKMNFVLSNVPVVQYAVQASLIIEPEIEVPNAEIYILLPEEFSLVKGNIQWRGNLLKNRTMRLDVSMAAKKIGVYCLEAIAVMKPSDGYPKISSTRLYTSVVEREEDFKPVLLENMTQIDVTDLGTNEKIPNENAAPSSPGTITVYGYWNYYDQSNNLKPCRYVRVELWDGDFPADVKLSTTYCQSNGYYQFPAINNDDGLLEDGYDIYVKVFCDSDLEVYVTDGSGGTYWAQTDKHDNAADGMHNMGSYAISGSNRGCFGLYDNIVDEYWWLYNRVGWARSEVQVRWPTETWPHSHGNVIDVPSGWEWDRMMVLHEYAHCIHYAARGGSWPSGSGPDPHYIYSESSGGFAITEGWAEFMQCAVDNNGGYGFGTEQSIETNTWADTTDSGDWDGNIVEGAVASIFWDIFDGTSSSDEPWGDYINQEFTRLWTVFLNDDPNDMQTNFWNGWQSIYGAGFNEWSVFHGSKINKDTTLPSNPTSYTVSPPTNVWINDNTIDITLNGATDSLSGIWGYYYSWTNSPSDPYPGGSWSTSPTLPTKTVSDGYWYLNSRSKDKAENVAGEFVYNANPWKIDATAPNNPTSHSSSHTAGSWSTDNTIDVTWSGASDGSGSGVYGYSYSWSMSPELPDTIVETTGTSASSPPLSDGWWYLNTRTQDNAGNWAGSAYQIGPFKIDTTPPAGIIQINNNAQYTMSTAVTLSAQAVDGQGSGVAQMHFRNEGESWGSWQPYTSSPISWNLPSGDGNKRVYVQFKDNVGLTSTETESYDDITLDTSPPFAPTISSSTHPDQNTWYSNDDPTFAWTIPSDLSGIAGYSYAFDQTPSTVPDNTIEPAGTSKFYLDVVSGEWYFHIKAIDNAGNWGATSHYRIRILTNENVPDTGFSAWASVAPTIDGIIGAGEWADADFREFYVGPADSHRAILYIKNDLNNLYIAFKIEGVSYGPEGPSCDVFRIWFDNDNDGIQYEDGDDILMLSTYDFDFYGLEDLFYRTDISHFAWDTGFGGSSDGQGRWTHTNPSLGAIGDYVFELSHPLDSSDNAHDFSLRLNDQVGFYFEFDENHPSGFPPGSMWDFEWPDDRHAYIVITEPTSLVVRGSDNKIYYRSYNFSSGSWGSWNVLLGATCDSPAAAVCNNELHVVVRGTDGNTLWHGYVDLATSTFSGWTLLSGCTPSAPTLTSNGTVLSLVVRGDDNRIYYRTHSFSPRGWGSWNALTGTTCGSPAVAMLGNNLHVIVRGFSLTNPNDNNTLWHIVVQPNVGVVRNWIGVSGATTSKPALTADQTENKLYLTVRGDDSRIYWRTYDGSADSWAGWSMVPTGTTGDAPAATVTGNKLQIVVRDMDGSKLWHGNLDLATSTFSGWTWISGSTPSTPTLTS